MHTEIIDRVSGDRLKTDLFSLCRDPFSFRTVLYTVPWHERNSLDETDLFIFEEMKKCTSNVQMMPYKLQPFRCDRSKPIHRWYSGPLPEDPWYDANCIEVVFPGSECSDEIIQLVSHKDSMSWINSPGAQDNATGTVANMELARILSTLPLRRTVRILFCNEEHWPWYSVTYANDSAANGDKIIAVINNDSLCGKSDEDLAAGLSTFAAIYSTPEGKSLADLFVKENIKYKLPMTTYSAAKGWVGDDDGSFIKAGYLRTAHCLGSWPYADSQYHLPGDVPERVNIDNLTLSVKLILATILDIDADGEKAFD